MIGAKIYICKRNDDGTLTVYVKHKGKGIHKLDFRFDLQNHSPTGFECGYAGSGPAQLALAICADVLGDDAKALAIHQQFKFKIIEMLPRDAEWCLEGSEALKTIEEIFQEGN
jgi:hypothetical protein